MDDKKHAAGENNPYVNKVLKADRGGTVIGGNVTNSEIRTEVHIHEASLDPDYEAEREGLLLLAGKVRDFWVEGLLKQSIHHTALLDLEMEGRDDLVARPFDRTVAFPDKPIKVIDADETIVEVFDEAHRALLILGAPGSGKTITLLELAQDLLMGVKENPLQKIPVVLKLSYWGENHNDLKEWVVEQLNKHYKIPAQDGSRWVNKNRLILLLDGLDEVDEKYRKQCARAINEFRNTHGFSGIAVSSRLEEYEKLAEWLELGWAILLQPLTLEQVDKYLEQLGPRLSALRETLKKDNGLQELAQKPLTLSVMVMAYQDLSRQEVESEPGISEETRLSHLFASYVTRMFNHRGLTTHFPHGKIKGWIAWLAKKLTRTEFLLEEIQPDWLSSKPLQRLYWFILGTASLLPIFLLIWIIPLFIVPVFYTSGIPFAQEYHFQNTAPLFGLSFCWMMWLMLRQCFGWKFIVSVGILISVSVFVALVETVGSEDLALAAGIILGPIFSVLFEWYGRKQLEGHKQSKKDIQPFDIEKFSWPRFFYGAFVGSVFGFIVYIFVAFTTISNIFQPYGQSMLEFFLSFRRDPRFMESMIYVWQATGKTIVGIITMLFGLIMGLVSGNIEIDRTASPNRGTWLSGKNGLRMGVLIAIGIGLPILLGGESDRSYAGYSWGFWAMLTVFDIAILLGYSFGLFFGGFAFIQHFLLRFFFWRKGWLPWNVPQFLEDSTDLIFLRKVGYGHVFIHRYLQDYFASLDFDTKE